jgi:two-component system chemotaxis response regulator CheB
MGSTAHRIITIGASAGGVEALQSLVRELPADLPVPIFVVLHLSADSPGLMPAILSRAGTLVAKHPDDGEAIAPGRIYVAPPDTHMLVDPAGRIRLSRGPKENRFRPAIDPLFRSAAHAFGPRVVGVVLTGALDDGTAGLWAIKRHGGLAVVQDPKDAFVPSMPLSALRYVDVDHCVPLARVAPLLRRLADDTVAPRLDLEARQMDVESRLILGEGTEQDINRLGPPSPYACPDCHGSLHEIREDNLVRYRCHVGHAYSTDTLLSDLTRKVGDALWNALRAIQESATLLREQAEQARTDGDLALCGQYLQKVETARMNADAVKAVAMRQERLTRDRLKAMETG